MDSDFYISEEEEEEEKSDEEEGESNLSGPNENAASINANVIKYYLFFIENKYKCIFKLGKYK